MGWVFTAAQAAQKCWIGDQIDQEMFTAAQAAQK